MKVGNKVGGNKANKANNLQSLQNAGGPKGKQKAQGQKPAFTLGNLQGASKGALA